MIVTATLSSTLTIQIMIVIFQLQNVAIGPSVYTRPAITLEIKTHSSVSCSQISGRVTPVYIDRKKVNVVFTPA